MTADRPDLGLLAATPVIAALDATLWQTLEPQVVTDIQRSSRTLQLDGSTTVEVALDEGLIRSGDATEPVHELELELKNGSIGPLYHFALELQSALPLWIGVEAKATRGYRLAAGRPPAAVKPDNLVLDRDIVAAAGCRRIVATALDALLANQPAAAIGDVEGVHLMRTAIRRVRAAQLLFKPHLEPLATKQFEAELRRLGRILGEARDWDVFRLETLPTALRDDASDSLLHLLGQAAERNRQTARQRVVEELAQPSLTRLGLGMLAWIEDTADFPHGAAMQGSLSALVPGSLDRLARKVRRRGRRIERRADAELHALRKSLKKLRYAVAPVRGLFSPEAAEFYLHRCKKLQRRLGRINDAANAVTLAEQLSGQDRLDLAPALNVVTQWSAKERCQAQRGMARAWKKFRAAPEFWR